MTAPLSNQVIALYDPIRDRWGEVAWRELRYASPAIKAAWMEHHFGWSTASREASGQIGQWGKNCSIELDLINVQTNGAGENRLAELTVAMTIHRPRVPAIVIEETFSDESFGQVAFFVGNSGRLADYVYSRLE